MHIWYVHHYGGGPGIGFYDRPYRLARAWQAAGHSATIFIARFHHLLETGAQLEADNLVDGVRYVGIPARAYSENGFARLFNIWDFSRNIYAVGRLRAEDIPQPDAIVVSSPHPFAIYPAHALARRHGAKLAFEIRDIWPLSITEILGTSRLHPFVLLCAATERFALKKSHLIASLLPRADRYLADRGYREKPFVWVPNGIKIGSEAAAQPFASEEARGAAATLQRWRAEGKVTVIYTGSVGVPNAIELLLNALVHGGAIGDEAPIGVVIAGKGDQLAALRTFKEQQGLSNVHFSGPLPKNDAQKLLHDADIGYAGLRNIERLFGYGVSPNKIADYFSASLPVLLPIAPCGDPVSESGGGIARRAETPEAVWNALSELTALSPDERRAMGALGKSYMAREYGYDRIARRYIEAIEAA